MGRPTPFVQRGFSGGLVSPVLFARGDTERYELGARDLLNVWVLRHGGAANRPGTKYINAVKTSSDTTRVMSWVFDDDDRFALELGNGYIRFYQDGARISVGTPAAYAGGTTYTPGDTVESGGTNYICIFTTTGNAPPNASFWYALSGSILEVPTPYTAAQVFDVKVYQSFDVMWLTHPSHAPRELIRRSNTSWYVQPMAFGPSIAPPTGLAVTGPGGTGFDFRYVVTAVKEKTFEESLPAHVTATTTGVAINGGNTERIILLYPAPHGLATGDQVHVVAGSVLTIAGNLPSATLEQQLGGKTFAVEVKDADEVYLEGTNGLVNGGGVDCTVSSAFVQVTNDQAPTTAAPARITWTEQSDAQEYYIYRSYVVTGQAPSGVYGFIGVSKSGSFDDTVGLGDEDTSDTPPQYNNPFTATNGFPSTVGMHKGRLIFAATNNEPSRFWMSRIEDFRNFAHRSPLQDDDSVTGVISGAQAIRSIVDLDTLVMHASNRLYFLEGDADGVIRPTAIGAAAHGQIGTSALFPLQIDDSVLFTEARGSTVRDFRLDAVEFQKGRDLTVYSPHLVDGIEVVDWCYQRIPHSTVWAVREDGVLLGLTYVREQEIAAWHRHITGSGTDFGFESVAVIPDGGEDRVYAVVKRVVNGSTVRYIEYFTARKAGEASYTLATDGFFVDSGLTYNGLNLKYDASAAIAGTTLTIATGTTYVAGQSLTLTASNAVFEGAAGDVGDKWRLVGSDGSSVDVTVTVQSSSTVCTVTSTSNIPASLQATATTTWYRLISTATGLSHLEARSVTGLGDGVVIDTATVSGGSITLKVSTVTTFFAVVHVGLAYTSDIETLDIDSPDSPIMAARKRAPKAMVLVHNSRSVQAGPDSSNLVNLEDTPVAATSTTALFSGKQLAPLKTDYGFKGSLLIRQAYPLPMLVEGIALATETQPSLAGVPS